MSDLSPRLAVLALLIAAFSLLPCSAEEDRRPDKDDDLAKGTHVDGGGKFLSAHGGVKSSAAEQLGLRRTSRSSSAANSRSKPGRKYRAMISYITRREISTDLALDASQATPAVRTSTTKIPTQLTDRTILFVRHPPQRLLLDEADSGTPESAIPHA